MTAVPKPLKRKRRKGPKAKSPKFRVTDLAMKYARMRAGNKCELSGVAPTEENEVVLVVHHVWGRKGALSWLPENLICIDQKIHFAIHHTTETRKMQIATDIRRYFGEKRWKFLEDESRKPPTPIKWSAVEENLTSMVAWVAAGKHAQRECFCVPPDSEPVPPKNATQSRGV